MVVRVLTQKNVVLRISEVLSMFMIFKCRSDIHFDIFLKLIQEVNAILKYLSTHLTFSLRRHVPQYLQRLYNSVTFQDNRTAISDAIVCLQRSPDWLTSKILTICNHHKPFVFKQILGFPCIKNSLDQLVR